MLGLVAILANLQILRLPWSAPARALGALGCLAVAFVVSYAISVLLFA